MNQLVHLEGGGHEEAGKPQLGLQDLSEVTRVEMLNILLLLLLLRYILKIFRRPGHLVTDLRR